MEGGWYDPEAIEDERREADMLQAQYEAEGNRAAERDARVRDALQDGRIAEAQELCDHQGGYWLSRDGLGVSPSPAAQGENDPRAGEKGFRCWTCGAVVTDLGGQVIHSA